MTLAQKIMGRVAEWERRRLTTAGLSLIVIVLSLMVIGGYWVGVAKRQLDELGSWDLLQYVSDESEALAAFWEELPKDELMWVALASGGMGMLAVWLGKKWSAIRQKIAYLTKITRRSNNRA